MTYTQLRSETMPIPVEPAVLAIHLPAPSGATVDIPVYIPWKHCQLVYAYTATTFAEAAVDVVAIDLELNAAGGTTMGAIEVANGAAVGEIDELVISGQSACENLSSDNAARDAVNIQIVGGSSTNWQGTLYMYFEVWAGE